MLISSGEIFASDTEDSALGVREALSGDPGHDFAPVSSPTLDDGGLAQGDQEARAGGAGAVKDFLDPSTSREPSVSERLWLGRSINARREVSSSTDHFVEDGDVILQPTNCVIGAGAQLAASLEEIEDVLASGADDAVCSVAVESDVAIDRQRDALGINARMGLGIGCSTRGFDGLGAGLRLPLGAGLTFLAEALALGIGQRRSRECVGVHVL
jgi:hypothetical protein